ncbi:MAG: hypothetical protein JJT94_11290 [Bernardetiaceae bacterium]|nr:hypothetical protein [Bernardetiaceae bacterium]
MSKEKNLDNLKNNALDAEALKKVKGGTSGSKYDPNDISPHKPDDDGAGDDPMTPPPPKEPTDDDGSGGEKKR